MVWRDAGQTQFFELGTTRARIETCQTGGLPGPGEASTGCIEHPAQMVGNGLVGSGQGRAVDISALDIGADIGHLALEMVHREDKIPIVGMRKWGLGAMCS